MRIAEISTTLRHRFEVVRGDRPIQAIAQAIGINHQTLCQWLAQYRVNRITVLMKIEAWVEREENTDGTRAN